MGKSRKPRHRNPQIVRLSEQYQGLFRNRREERADVLSPPSLVETEGDILEQYRGRAWTKSEALICHGKAVGE